MQGPSGHQSLLDTIFLNRIPANVIPQVHGLGLDAEMLKPDVLLQGLWSSEQKVLDFAPLAASFHRSWENTRPWPCHYQNF